jgi:hypothetical protein
LGNIRFAVSNAARPICRLIARASVLALTEDSPTSVCRGAFKSVAELEATIALNKPQCHADAVRAEEVIPSPDTHPEIFGSNLRS